METFVSYNYRQSPNDLAELQGRQIETLEKGLMYNQFAKSPSEVKQAISVMCTGLGVCRGPKSLTDNPQFADALTILDSISDSLDKAFSETWKGMSGQARGDWAITNKTKIVEAGKAIRAYIDSLDSAKFEVYMSEDSGGPGVRLTPITENNVSTDDKNLMAEFLLSGQTLDDWTVARGLSITWRTNFAKHAQKAFAGTFEVKKRATGTKTESTEQNPQEVEEVEETQEIE